MCTVSDKLKLCTCKTENVEQLKNYWILKRPIGKRSKQNKEIEYGVYILPADVSMYYIRQNWTVLLNLLNDEYCFDVKLPVVENDILELHFTFKDTTFSYEFKYKKKKWRVLDDYQHCATDNNIGNGKITNPFLSIK